MNLAAIQDAERHLLVPTYDRHPILFTTGQGVYLFDEEGEAYLDLLSGIGVSALGYGHPAIEAAIAFQSKRLLHTSNLFYHEGTARLALQLTQISGLARVFLCNSGTEAWEAALKIARAHAGLVRASGRRMGTRFLALEHSFHGRTMGSIATTHKQQYRQPFSPTMPGVDFIRVNDIANLEKMFTEEVCAICIEPLQGEGGIRPISAEFFAAAKNLAAKTGALLIADEIQCGFGRTGTWFAYQKLGLIPDIATIAKPMAGGLPLGAMLCTEEVARAFTPGMHGTTFGGGPLACSVASAVIDTIQDDRILENVAYVGHYFKHQLEDLARQHSEIVDVRGIGLMLGLEFSTCDLARDVASAMMSMRIIVNRTSETVLRFLPPYILECKHVDVAVDALSKIMSRLPAYAASAKPQGEFHE